MSTDAARQHRERQRRYLMRRTEKARMVEFELSADDIEGMVEVGAIPSDKASRAELSAAARRIVRAHIRAVRAEQWGCVMRQGVVRDQR